MSYYKHMNKKTKQNKRNWHIACCATNKASLSTTLQSCELFIPTPAQFSSTSDSCTQFLHQCFLVFDQQWQTSATDTNKTVFMSDLLTEKAACLGSRSFTVETHQSATPIVFFTSEMTKVFDGPLQPGVNYSPSIKGQGQPQITMSTSEFWPLSADGPNPHSMRFFGMDYVRSWTTSWRCTANPRDLRNLLSSPSAWTTALRSNAESRWQADGELPSPRGHRWELDNVVWGNPGLDAGGKTSTPSPFPAPTEVAMQCGHSGGGSAFGSLLLLQSERTPPKQMLRSAKVFEPSCQQRNAGELGSGIFSLCSTSRHSLLFSIFCFPDIY